MHLLLTALGSYGDLLPLVGLGAAMRSRGHRATMIANPHFEAIVRQADVELIPFGTEEEYEGLTDHPDLWHPFRGPKFVLGYAAKFHRQLYNAIESAYVPRETVIAAHGLDLASRTFHDKTHAPLATVHLAPLSIRSLAAPPRMIGMMQGPGVPRWLTALQFWLGDRLVVDRVVGPELNDLRSELQLPPVERIYCHWHNSPDLVLGLWPDWFGSRQPDWPSQTVLTGFPLWDSGADRPVNGDLLSFLEDHDRPVVFSPGSANAQADEFFRVAAEVCRGRNWPGVFATKYPGQLPDPLPPHVQHVDFVPFSQLLSRASALVHHGGIGTSAQALAAGIPQLIMPMAYDQLDNAHRLQNLGVGQFLKRQNFTADRVASALEHLLASSEVSDHCQDLASQCDGQASLDAACEALERLFALKQGAPASVRS